MTLHTKSQADMELALRCVQDVGCNTEMGDGTRRIYGGLCHSFPVMVRSCGLCQALAFSEAKASDKANERGKAHAFLLMHVKQIAGVDGDLLDAVRKADTVEYMLYTRRVLSAWIYFKRFAESVLGVKSAKEGQDAAGDP